MQKRFILPRITLLSIVAIAAVTLSCFVWPLLSSNKTQWNAGPLANAHGMIGHDCIRCHTRSFQEIGDDSCEQCHSLTDHSSKMSKIQTTLGSDPNRCIDCHKDHRGENGLIESDSRLCLECHVKMQHLLDDKTVNNIVSWNSHPKFDIPETDSSSVKLNHQVHLKPGIRGPDGATNLQCSSCHKYEPLSGNFKPITFDSECRTCHSLNFDERLASRQVPHAKANVVFASLVAQYTELTFAQESQEPAYSDFAIRRRPGFEPNNVEKALSLSKEAILSSARQAETELFTRTACVLCHQVDHNNEQSAELDSRFKTKPVELSLSYLPGAKFRHAAHEEVSCTSCHQNIESSTKTEELHMPQIENCRNCHSEGSTPSGVKSECRLCHTYHSALPLESKNKHDLKDLIHQLNIKK